MEAAEDRTLWERLLLGLKGLLRVTEALKVEPGSHENRCSLSRVSTSEKSCRENLAYGA